jgi:hypothetical protein
MSTDLGNGDTTFIFQQSVKMWTVSNNSSTVKGWHTNAYKSSAKIG